MHTVKEKVSMRINVVHATVNQPETLSVMPSKKTKDIIGGLNLCRFCLAASMYSPAISPTDFSPN